jgi:hypothetical protein
MYGWDGAEYLAEQSASGAITQLREAGPWARWPAGSSDGRYILYTSRAHRVEYWVASNVTAPDSPIFLPAHPGGAPQSIACNLHPPSLDFQNGQAVRISPLSYRHR